MRSEKQAVMKYLPEITMKRPQLRNSSWSRLLGQGRTTMALNKDKSVVGVDLVCTPLHLNFRGTMKNRQESLGNLTDFEKRIFDPEENDNLLDEKHFQHNDSGYVTDFEKRFFDDHDENGKNSDGRHSRNSDRNVTDFEKRFFDDHEENDNLLDKGHSQNNDRNATLDEVSLDRGTKQNVRSVITSKISKKRKGSKDAVVQRDDRANIDHLPPLTNTVSKQKDRGENNFSLSKDVSVRRMVPGKQNDCIDWQNIFVQGGFRPKDSRDLPTRGEINLLKFKTWSVDDPMHCIAKCAKYYGLQSVRGSEKVTQIRQEPEPVYHSPPPRYRFFPLRMSTRHKNAASGSSSHSPLYIKNSHLIADSMPKRHNLCDSCVVPPVTPTSPLVSRSSPYGWKPFLTSDSRRNSLEELSEFSQESESVMANCQYDSGTEL